VLNLTPSRRPCISICIQKGFAQTAALGVLVRSEAGPEAQVSICYACAADLQRKSANAMPVQRIWSDSQHMRCLCRGFQVTFKRKWASAMHVQRIHSESQHMRCLYSVFVWVRRWGRTTSGALVTRIFTKSERFTKAGASFARKPALWGCFKWPYIYSVMEQRI